jgi:predicted DNA-binding transcriptional regulator
MEDNVANGLKKFKIIIYPYLYVCKSLKLREIINKIALSNKIDSFGVEQQY